MPTTAPTTEFGRRLRQIREDRGLRLIEVSYKVSELLGSRATKVEAIRRAEVGVVPEEAMDPLVIAALADIYQVPTDWLSPRAAEQAQMIKALLDRHFDSGAEGEDEGDEGDGAEGTSSPPATEPAETSAPARKRAPRKRAAARN